MIARGVNQALTAHEAQGGRSEYTFIHSVEGYGLCPDLGFLGSAERRAHFGVAITRARKGTVFIVKDLATARTIPYCAMEGINGYELHTDVLFAGTHYDLVDPITQSDIVYERMDEPKGELTDVELSSCDTNASYGSFINTEDSEAIPLEAFTDTVVDVGCAAIINTHIINQPYTSTETFQFRPAHVQGSGLMNMIERRTKPVAITPAHFRHARRILRVLFDRVIDPNKFFMIANHNRSALVKQTRDKVMKMALAKHETRSDTVSFAFPKNEDAKKVMTLGKGLKTLSVTAMNQTQLMLFGDVCETLTHAWSRALRTGITSPVGITREQVNAHLGSFSSSWELDLEKQDSTHTPVHVAVFVLLIEITARRQGLAELAAEIRSMRVIGDMQGTMRMTMGTGLGSGDQWTLIANKIMAFSTLVCRYEIPKFCRMLQVGDDITVDRKLRELETPLIGSEGVTLTIVDNTRGGRPTFTSFTSINESLAVAARIRAVIKMATQPRTMSQHLSFKVEVEQLLRTISAIGLHAYCEAHHQLFHTEPAFIEELIMKAKKIADIKFDELPNRLRMHGKDEKLCEIFSRSHGCFGYALAFAANTNVEGLNALATYSRTCTLDECINVCKANKVNYKVMKGKWSNKSSPEQVSEDYIGLKQHQPMIYLYDNHAVCVKSISSEFITFGGTNRYRINIMTEEIEELEM
jgi:hypothetical protein